MLQSDKAWIRTGWTLVGLLILIMILFAALRIFQTYSSVVQQQLFEARYQEHPVVSALHMFTGIAFLLFAPLQFLSKFRNKNLGRHRMMGRVLVGLALVAGIYGLVVSVVLPAFGGLATASAAWFFGLLFLLFLVRAFSCARKRQFPQHREWMIRTFALALGVGTQRVFIPILMIGTQNEMVTVFGPALWLGFGINLLIAETWINQTRSPK